MKLRLEKELGESSMRHGAEIRMMAVAHDDSVLVAADGGQPGRGVVWDLATGAARTSVASRTYGFTAAAISKDGTRIAVSGYDNRAVVFDAKSGKRLHSFDTRAAAHAMAFSPDGQWLLVGDDRVPRLFPMSKGEPRALKGHLSALKDAAFSPDGRYAATAAGDRKIKLHDVGKAKVLATMEGYASLVAFIANGTQLLYVGFDCGAIVEVPSGKPLEKLGLGYLATAAISGDGRRLAINSGRDESKITILDLESGKKVFERSFEPVRHVALSHAGDRLVIARAAMLGQGTSLEVWSVPEGERLLPKGDGHLGGVAAVASYGRMAVSASADRTLKLWDVDAAIEVETIEGGHDGIGVLAADGKNAITARGYGRESPIQRWDLAKLRVSGELEAGDLGAARALAIAPDGRTAAAGFVRRAALFDLATGKRRAVLEKHKAQIDAIAFSADGAHVITGAADHLVKIWSAKDGKEQRAIQGHTGFVHAVAPLPDGTCVSGSSELLRFEISTGKQLAKVSSAEVAGLAASPDGKWLLVLRPFDSTIQLWSLAHGSLEGPVHSEKLQEEPSAATFVGPTTLLVGTRRGRLLRFALIA